MRRAEFDTGKAHQRQTARWIRRRLIDVGSGGSAGRCFRTPEDQDGVLLADPVGLGKTWEALAGAAVILAERGQKYGLGRVLVLCPPNLISKWEEELGAGSAFRRRLARWVNRGSGNSRRCAGRTLTQVIPVRRARDVSRRKRWGKLTVQAGTYLVSFNLMGKGGHRVSALKKADWQVIIVDEAHHLQARTALAKLQARHKRQYKLLLSATPFQLTPTELDRTAAHIVRGRGPLRDRAVREFVEGVERRFHDPDAPMPSATLRRAAEDRLGKLIARSRARRSVRRYGVLCPDGKVVPLPQRLDRMGDDDVEVLLAKVRRTSSKQSLPFEKAYLERRLRLANRERDRSTFVATDLRRMLSLGTPLSPSPRLSALRGWAEGAMFEDLRMSLSDGRARKTIVFTSWVGERDIGEAAALQRLLNAALEAAIARFERQYGRAWRRLVARGRTRLSALVHWAHQRLKDSDETLSIEISAGLEQLYASPLWLALLGAGRHTASSVRRLVEAEHERLREQTLRLSQDVHMLHSFEHRGAIRRRRNAWNALRMWTDPVMTSPVVRYTGSETRTERDWASSAFRGPGLPWVMVASNVGSEGIDLHTYTRRIVHYDLEWNPAKMEQREGRGDREGRILRDPLDITYAIVPRTYDERMLHQLVARDRWHGVLLGKAAARLAEDKGEMHARLEASEALQRMTLDLRPR